MAALPTSIPKRIIICCDGTWQSAVSGEENSPSNVTRLARSLNRVAEQDGKVWQQIVWYDSGIGTTSGWLGKKLEGAIGAGIEGNIIEAYNFVVLNWSPGDQVLCFGFSRGAYTARSIAGLISDIGICEPRQLQDFHLIWEAYKSNYQGECFEGSDAYYDFIDGIPAADEDQPDDFGYARRGLKWKQPARGHWAISPQSKEIEVVGVYDTVGALGVPDVLGYKMQWGPDKHGFHNVKLNPNIKHAFQALALDEHREAFSPTLWYLPEGPSEENGMPNRSIEEQLAKKQMHVNETSAAWYSKAYDKKVPLAERQQLKAAYNQARRELSRLEECSKKPSTLRQVWFPGVHINIGGGSSDSLKDKGDLEEMANITFSWMLDQISNYVSINETVINQDARARQNHIDELNRKQREFELKVAQGQREAAERSWGQWASHTLAAAADTVLHPLSKPKEPNTDRHDVGWGTGTIIDSYTPMYRLNGAKPRTPGAYVKVKGYDAPGSTNEEVHPTVGYRYKMFRKLARKLKNDKLLYYPAGVSVKNGFNRTWNEAEGRWEYRFPGEVVLREYKIKPYGFERRAMAHDDDMWKDAEGKLWTRETTFKYMQRLDIQNGEKVDDGMDEVPSDEDGDYQKET